MPPKGSSKAAGANQPATAHATAKPKAAKRELITLPDDRRYVRRDPEGQFKESDDVGRSLSQDHKKTAKNAVKEGQGDKGDRRAKT